MPRLIPPPPIWAPLPKDLWKIDISHIIEFPTFLFAIELQRHALPSHWWYIADCPWEGRDRLSVRLSFCKFHCTEVLSSSGFRGGRADSAPPLWATDRRRRWQWSFFCVETHQTSLTKSHDNCSIFAFDSVLVAHTLTFSVSRLQFLLLKIFQFLARDTVPDTAEVNIND